MKAYVLHGIGDIRYEEVKLPRLREHTALVEVKAAGICGSDIPRIYKTGAYSYPLIPGHEFAGVVADISTEEDKAWLYKRVGVFPLIPCKECAPCRKEQYEMCMRYDYLGSRSDGGFARYVRVPVWNLIELPEEVSMEQAAMLEPMAVAVHAIRRAGVGKNDKIAVCGLGTIGLLLVMFLREMGCQNILAIGNKELQKNLVTVLGVPERNYCTADSCAEHWIAEKTEGEGVDIFFDCVGKNDTLLHGIHSAAAGGKVQLVGNPVSDMNMEKNTYWKILRKQLAVYGTWNSSFTHSEEDDWHYVLRRLKEGTIQPEKMITHRYPFSEIRDGLELMHDRKEEYVKVMGIREN